MSDDGIGMLPVMAVSDMLPREVFLVGDKVSCPGGECGTGIIVDIDPDYRLARVEWRKGKIGWWYLKDLVIERPISATLRSVFKDSKYNCVLIDYEKEQAN